MNKKILILGKFPPPVGGTTVSLLLLKKFLEQYQQYEFVDLTSFSFSKNFLNSIKILFSLFRAKCWSFHVSDFAAIHFLPYMFVISQILQKKFVYRQFGASIISSFENSTKFQKILFKIMLNNSSLCYFQTRYLVDYFSGITSKGRIKWLPTHRFLPNVIKNSDRFLGKTLNIIYVGRLEEQKGIKLIVETCKDVENCKLHLYGPVGEKCSVNLDQLPVNVEYHGVIDPFYVQEALCKADLMLLISSHPGEGYSGTIIEAITTSTPMILSNIKQFREILTKDQAIFIDKHDECALKRALNEIKDNREILISMSNEIGKIRNNYDINIVGEDLHKDHIKCVDYSFR